MTDLGLHHIAPIPARRLIHRTRAATRLDRAGVILLLFSGLNLNGIILLYARVQAQFSPLVFALTLLLLLRYARRNVFGPRYILFMVFIGSYLTFGSLFSLTTEGEIDYMFLRSYTATPILVSALYFWLRTLSEGQLERTLRLFKHLLVAACALTLFSGTLSHFFDYVAPPERASGVFENPDEAAVAALYCIVLTTAYPNAPILLVGQICVAVAALALTFSKAGFGMLLLITAIIAIRRRSLLLTVAVSLGIAAVLWAVWWAYQNGLFTLIGEQRQRFNEMFSILGGEIDTQTTSGRTLVWELGLSKIEASLPWGSGLGSFHWLEGGYRNTLHEWLGIHNTYLMVLGESGLIPFLLFVAFLIRLCAGAYRSRNPFVALSLLLIVCGDMSVTHGVLGFRLANTILAILMAFGDRAASRPAQWALRWHCEPPWSSDRVTYSTSRSLSALSTKAGDPRPS
jgi:O-antigen ligase